MYLCNYQPSLCLVVLIFGIVGGTIFVALPNGIRLLLLFVCMNWFMGWIGGSKVILSCLAVIIFAHMGYRDVIDYLSPIHSTMNFISI